MKTLFLCFLGLPQANHGRERQQGEERRQSVGNVERVDGETETEEQPGNGKPQVSWKYGVIYMEILGYII